MNDCERCIEMKPDFASSQRLRKYNRRFDTFYGVKFSFTFLSFLPHCKTWGEVFSVFFGIIRKNSSHKFCSAKKSINDKTIRSFFFGKKQIRVISANSDRRFQVDTYVSIDEIEHHSINYTFKAFIAQPSVKVKCGQALHYCTYNGRKQARSTNK